MNTANQIRARYALRREGFNLNVDLDLPLRGITGLFGVSGAGKTTLLRCIAGLERAAGRLEVAGAIWQDSTANQWRRVAARNIGYVFQEPRLFDHLNVRRNIEYGSKRRSGSVDTDHIIELLGLRHLMTRRTQQLSGGEAQRVAIARALASAPEFVLMDEPLASLDQARKDEILPYLDRIHAEAAVPIIYVSHNLDEVCRLCDQLIVMDAGSVVANGSLQDVLVQIDSPWRGGAQAGSVIDAVVVEFSAADGLANLEFSGGSLWVASDYTDVGSRLRVHVRASDVSLCRTLPEQTTILNVLPAVIESIASGDGSSALVRLRLGNDKLLALITRRSIRELRLEQGDEVFAQIKSVAVKAPRAPA